jgi:hypothetical protein
MNIRKVTLWVILSVVLTTCNLSNDDNGADNDWPLIGAHLQYAVTLDGQISSANEWSDTDYVDMDWDLGMHPDPLYVKARVWAKNDNLWLYVLYRIEWPSTDTDVEDAAQIAHYWGIYVPPWEYSDLGHVKFGGSSWDGHGWDGSQWYSDTDAGGENNVEGAATHLGTYYWFELRKELCSGEEYDWCLIPGETYYFLTGIWDPNPGEGYHSFAQIKIY